MSSDDTGLDILYGDTSVRSESGLTAIMRLDWISKEVVELEQAKHWSGLTFSDIPKDFILLLEEGMPADDRVPRLIEVLGGRWMINTAASDGTEALETIFKLLAWGPAAVVASEPSPYQSQTIEHTWKNLVKAALRLAGRQKWRDRLEQAIKGLIDDHQLPFAEFPELIALKRKSAYAPDGTTMVTHGLIHCQSADPGRTLCGKKTGSNLSAHEPDPVSWCPVPRVIQDNPLELLEEPECKQCLSLFSHFSHFSHPGAAYKPLNAEELTSHALARAKADLPDAWVARPDITWRHTPELVRAQLAEMLWRHMLLALPMKEPLDELVSEQLAAIAPLR